MKRSERESSNQKPPDAIVLVLDENLSGHSIYNALISKGLPVHRQFDFVARGASDLELVAGLAKDRNRVLITKDRDFRYKGDLIAQLLAAGMRVFALTAAGNKRGEDIVDQIVKSWPRIQRFLKKHRAPFVAKISSNADISLHRS